MGLFDELGDAPVLRPGGAAKVAAQRELELWRDGRALGQGYLYKSGGDWLLKHGHYYQGRELPDQYEHLKGEPRRCFMNAIEACKEDPSLRYCEGVYSTGGSCFTNHGWCIDAGGHVVEVTYPTTDLEDQTDNRGGPILPPEHWAYYGAIVTVELAEWHVHHIGLPMLERPPEAKREGDPAYQDAHDFPILKVPYDPHRTSL